MSYEFTDGIDYNRSAQAESDLARRAITGGIIDHDTQTYERQFISKDYEFTTNLPPGINVITPSASVMRRTIMDVDFCPFDLDFLPLGDYFVSGRVNSKDTPASEMKREFLIGYHDFGKSVDTKCFSETELPVVLPSTGYLMSKLGFSVVNDKVAAFPTPQTVVAVAKSLNLDIQLVQDYGKMPGSLYLESHAARKHPVSTLTDIYYLHDIGDDHYSARVLGGVLLTDVLADAAKKGLAGNQKHINTTASGIDTYTYYIRFCAAEGGPGEGYATTEQVNAHVRADVIQAGEEIGISAERTNKIIAYAQQRAREFNMNVRNLD